MRRGLKRSLRTIRWSWGKKGGGAEDRLENVLPPDGLKGMSNSERQLSASGRN